MASEVERGKVFAASWSLSARPCDSCKSSASLLFCRVDSAFLCLVCDSKIHHRNLTSRHERVWMCEVCEQAPASVTCKADAAALCVTCDSDIHSANPLAGRHERIPIVPFYDPPTTVRSDPIPSPLLLLKPSDGEDEPNPNNHTCGEEEEAEAASWLLPDPNPKPAEAPIPKSADYYFSDDVDPYLDLDFPSSGADSVVPVQQHLYDPIRSENCVDLDFRQSKPTYSYTAPSLCQSVSSSSLDVGVVPDGNSSSVTEMSNPYDPNPKIGSVPSSGLDREARVLRYREKRKNRKFEKTIRYASRKAYAETRPRIKGRFAKRAEIDTDLDRIYSSAAAAAIIADGGYGVVPSF